jgi:hypothetical protein
VQLHIIAHRFAMPRNDGSGCDQHGASDRIQPNVKL